MVKKTRRVREYIEIEFIDWCRVLASLCLYPVILFIGLTIFVFNFVRYNLRLLIYLIICLIPILNSGIVVSDKFEAFESFDEFRLSELFDALKKQKRFEVKREIKR